MKKRDLKAILFALSIGVFSMTGCGEASIDNDDLGAPFEVMLNDLADTTLLDEVLQSEEGKYSNLVLDFTKLEQCLITASKLNNLDLDSTNQDEVESKNILSTTDINQMISEIEFLDVNSNEYKNALDVLKYNEEILNQWISENGYRIVSQMGTLVAKTKLTEACNLDVSEYNHFSIFDHCDTIFFNTSVKYSNHDIEKTYDIENDVENDLNGNSLLLDLINDSYDFYQNQKNATEEKSDIRKYDSNLCKNLQYSIGLIKKNICSSFKEKNDRIYPIEPSYKVEEKYDKLLEKYKK